MQSLTPTLSQRERELSHSPSGRCWGEGDVSGAATLPPGAAGKVGELRLEFGPRAGRTRLLAMRCRVPFHVGRALHPERDWPELAHLLVTMPTGGFVQGDVATMQAVAHDGARIHLTSQSATRAYRCDTTPIRQHLSLEVRGDSLLEWWPDPLIPFAGARLDQDIDIVVDERSTLLVADCWLAGRIARGEIHQYARLAFTTSARRPDGSLLFRDTLRLEPARQAISSVGLLGDARAVGTFFLLGRDVASRLERPIADALALHLPDRAAVTRLPADSGLLVRVLARRSDDLRSIQREVLALARQHLFARGPGHIYKP
jgi:urease accessory protein